jgi:flagellar motor switch protein FliN/FliY
MEKTLNNQAAEQFALEFASCFTKIVAETAGPVVKFTVMDTPDLSKRPNDAIHFRVCVNSAPRGECFIEMYQASVTALGSKLLRELPDGDEHYTEAVRKAITDAIAQVKRNLVPSYGDMTLSVERVSDLVFGGMLVVPLAGNGLELDVPVLLYFSSGFYEALTGGAPSSGLSTAIAGRVDTRNLDLVMDVELNVSLRFGQRQMALRDVLELESGSVIELDRRVDDPVELLLDGKVIAVGEAVIVDGNYGLRVTRVPQPITSHWNTFQGN